MNSDDFIMIEEIENNDNDGITAVVIDIHPDGSISWKTTLEGPPQLLWLLKKVEKNILEDYLG